MTRAKSQLEVRGLLDRGMGVRHARRSVFIPIRFA